MTGFGLYAALGIIFVAVLVIPFRVKFVEHNLEPFLFIMGAIAATVSLAWSVDLITDALEGPIKITATVLVAGLVFHYFKRQVRTGIRAIVDRIAFGPFVFLVVVVLGLLSSVVSAIIAALILAEIVSAMDIDRKSAIKFVVISCFSIGFGAALTPLGEPLTTLAIAKLAGPPYHAGFTYMVGVVGKYVLPGVVAMGALGVFMVRRNKTQQQGLVAGEDQEKLSQVFIRAAKVYVFVMALHILGTGFKPLIDKYFSEAPSSLLYWINFVSAVLDNATLAAAEISPTLSQSQITAALMGLLIAGGALIPGNIPNIITAGKLKISSGEWARYGLPIGLVLMAVFFPFVLIFG